MTMLPPDPVYIFKGEMEPVSCVSFRITSNVEFIYAGTQSGHVHVWSLKTKREVGKFKAGDDNCLTVLVPREEDLLVTHTKSGEVTFWKEENNSWAATKKVSIDFFGFCKSQLFEDALYTSLKDCRFRVISLGTGDTTKTLALTEGDHLGEIMAFKVTVLNGRRVLLVACEAQRLILWGEEGEKISQLELEGCPMAVDLDSTTRKGLCGDSTDEILVFSLDAESRFKVEKKVKLMNAGVAAVRIRPDGKLVAVGCWDGKLRLYSWKTLVLLAVLDTHSGTVQDVSFGESYGEGGARGKYLLAAASQDSRISLWDLYNKA